MDLESPIERVPGVGPISAGALRDRGIMRVHDMLRILPQRYIDFAHITTLAGARIGDCSAFAVEIQECLIERTKRKFMTLVWARLKDDSGELWAVWFNQNYLVKTLKVGTRLSVYGTISFDVRRRRVLRNPELFFGKDARPVPRYGAAAGVESGRFAKMIERIVPLIDQVEDPLPQSVRHQLNIIGLQEAFLFGHRPHNMDQVAQARSRLALDELWAIMVQALASRQDSMHEHAHPIVTDRKLVRQDKERLAFELTVAQEEALDDVLRDLSKAIPMRRLLNGDVGSGKTVVAMLAAHQVLKNGKRAIFLSPTTILASQHFATWRALYPTENAFLITAPVCMIGDVKVSRKQAEAALAKTTNAFICGTHALLHRQVDNPDQTALVIVDEQHRFGVLQRAHLLEAEKVPVPHLLSMSATPIPRTAALVLYGDLDISLIKQKPHSRKVVVTKLASDSSREMVYRFVEQQIARGEQVFVVCPKIGLDVKDQEQSVTQMWGRLNLSAEKKAVRQEFDRLRARFPTIALGLLHGKMKQAEKEAVMEQFRSRQIALLVSTTVVEVGVDIPGATIMIVEGAEFFGLAQLHQLRGRVGRANLQSYCFLFAANWSPAVKQRLQLLVELSDGFQLAEKDLALRGPGELYGTLQAGYTPFQFASLADFDMVAKAREVASAVLQIPRQQWPGALENWLASRRSVHRE